MKKITLSVLASVIIAGATFSQNTFPSTGSAGIGTITPNASAALEIKSTTKGLLISRLTQAQRNAIVTPVTGLMIYQTDNTPGFYYYTGSVWKAVTPKAAWLLTGNAGTNPAINFLGTTDAKPLIFKVNNQQAGYLDYDELRGNSAFGYESLIANTSGTYNAASGSQALLSNTTGIFNTATGAHALYHTTIGYANTATGTSALAYNISGSFNTAVGVDASIRNTTGYSNVAIGMNALDTNLSGHNLVAVGDSALFNQNGGPGGNTAIGSKALYSNTTGGPNTANGYHALYFNTTGSFNTANGYQALYTNSLGTGNAADGYDALFSNTTGSFNTAVGDNAYPIDGTVNNYTGIGYLAGTNASTSNMVELGNSSVTVIRGEVNFSTYSDQRIKNNIKQNVPGLAFINLLKPVTYNMDIHKQNQLLYAGKKINDADKTANFEGKYNIEQQQMTGFLAQDVKKAAEAISYKFSGVVEPQNDHDLYSLCYSDFVVPLVKAVQELSTKNDSLQNANQQMQSQLAALMKRMDALETVQQQCCEKSISNKQSVSGNQQLVNRKDAARLNQNIPNPFNGSCYISYYIPAGFHSAQLLVTDVSGHTLKTYSLATPGYGKQVINGNELSHGMYQYSLLIDGKLIDTKKMEHLK